jgi:hydroxymethylpyrimidine pyrophosphatase-like HAD family hydrolase
MEDLLPVAKQFGITGPIIGENGLFAYYPGAKKTTYFLEENQLRELAKIKQYAEKTLLDILKSYFKTEVHWENADTVEVLSHQQNKPYTEGSVVVLNNKFRKYTISAHVKIYKDGKLTPITSQLDTITAQLQTALADKPVSVASSVTFSNILVYANSVSKRTAIEALQQGEFARAKLYAIGDELSDYSMVEGIGTFLTVGNSLPEVKKHAIICSQKNYAQGVHELLENIAQNE